VRLIRAGRFFLCGGGQAGASRWTSDIVIHTVRAEPVEALSFSLAAEDQRQGFDKLSPNGVWQ
jgi:hypothetical protein